MSVLLALLQEGTQYFWELWGLFNVKSFSLRCLPDRADGMHAASIDALFDFPVCPSRC